MKKSYRKLKGVTLVEVLIAILILGLVAGPVLMSLQAATQNNVLLRDRTIAVFVAQQHVEELINIDDASLSLQLGTDMEDAASRYQAILTASQIPYVDSTGAQFPDLAEVIITVTRREDDVFLYELKHVLYTS